MLIIIMTILVKCLSDGHVFMEEEEGTCHIDSLNSLSMATGLTATVVNNNNNNIGDYISGEPKVLAQAKNKLTLLDIKALPYTVAEYKHHVRKWVETNPI